jgi:hypothetical protein
MTWIKLLTRLIRIATLPLMDQPCTLPSLEYTFPLYKLYPSYLSRLPLYTGSTGNIHMLLHT